MDTHFEIKVAHRSIKCGSGLILLGLLTLFSHTSRAQSAVGLPTGAGYPVMDAAADQNTFSGLINTYVTFFQTLASAQNSATQLSRMGDPNALTGILNTSAFQQSLPLNSFQQPYSSLLSSANGQSAFNDTSNGLYQPLSNTSPGGNTVSRNYSAYTQYSVASQIRDQHINNSASYATSGSNIATQISDTLSQLDAAQTETEIAKLHAKLTALVAQQQALSDQLHKGALDSTVQANDRAAQQQKQEQAAKETYDTDAQANFAKNRAATLPTPSPQPVTIQ